MQRAEHQQPRLRRRERQGDGLQVAHLTHQHDIRILTQRGAQAVREGGAVGGHLALGDDALLGGVDELDRLLHRDDVAGEVGVDIIDERRQRGGLTGTRGPRDQHQPGTHLAEALDLLRHVELLQRQNLGGNETEHAAVAALLLHVVAAEAGLLVHLVGKVRIAAVRELLPEFRRADRLHQLNHVLVAQRGVLHGRNLAVHTDLRRLALGEVQVRAALVHQHLEIGIYAIIHVSKSFLG